MAFDSKKFLKTKFEPRTQKIKIEALKDFFNVDEEPEFLVRGLTGVEYNHALESPNKNKNLDVIIKALTNDNEKIQAIKDSIGLSSSDVPAEMVKRLEFLVAGSVEPKFDLPQAIAFAERFAIDFYYLTNIILNLTGLGYDVKK